MTKVVKSMLSFDKSKWSRVRLDSVVREVRQVVRDARAEGIDRIVGLEHIDSEDIHLRKWIPYSEETTFSKKFVKGQVLFGRRRAYLKKAALATFDGICSGDITVLEAKDGLVPELLPFLISNDGFFDYAVRKSAGSLSPRAKFKDLADYEFLLPPKDQQARLAELLWAGDEVVETRIALRDKIIKNYEILSEELIWPGNYPNESLVSFTGREKLVDGDWIESKDQSESGIRLLQLADIGLGEFTNKSRRYVTEDTFKRLRCFEVLPGDILIARMPDPIGRACVVENIGTRMITAVDCCILRTNSQLTREFLVHLLNSKKFLSIANSLASGTTRQRISRTNLESILVPKPTLEDQRRIVSKLSFLTRSKNEADIEIERIKQLQKSLINQIF